MLHWASIVIAVFCQIAYTCALEVSLVLEHDLGEGFKQAGTLRTTLEQNQVSPI
jgi:hypothetical protein